MYQSRAAREKAKCQGGKIADGWVLGVREVRDGDKLEGGEAEGVEAKKVKCVESTWKGIWDVILG